MKHQSIVSALFKNAALHPNKIALIIGAEPNITRVTYSELTHKILQSAKFLSDNDASKGQFVILSATQSTEFIACYFALHLIGAIAVPVDPPITIFKTSGYCQPMLFKNSNFYPSLQKSKIL